MIEFPFLSVHQRLRAVNGQAFEKLKNLELIGFMFNDCIDQGFSSTRNYANIQIAAKIVSGHCGYDEIETKEVACEKYRDENRYETCYMNAHTIIDSANFSVAGLRDEDVGGLNFEGNKKIGYLPVYLYKQFPNLYVYFAKSCAIKEITKENFEKLKRLFVLDLSYNNIQKIRADTFNGLTILGKIYLSELSGFLTVPYSRELFRQQSNQVHKWSNFRTHASVAHNRSEF